ncbi:MAG: DUF3078 domain-containing protein [Chlorobi bacterium]|nr:DUF3078 domain-containing protein [Chlorobiota bacterium]
MRNLLIICVAVLLFNSIHAQVIETENELKKQNIDTLSGWAFGGVTNINFSQMHFSENWAAGGQSSYTINGILSLFSNYKTENSSWDNNLDIGYGVLTQLNKEGENSTQKTDDKIEFASKYGEKASEHWYYAALFSFKSQMAEGFNYPDDSTVISKIFAPAYLIGAIGMDFKPNKDLSIFAAPLTGKMTIVNDDTLSSNGAFGVDPGQKSRIELGGFIKIAYSKNLMENVSLQTKIDLFSNYLNRPEKVDINWEILIAMKVNKYISANISTNLVYDFDVIDELQFKEVLGIGFSYQF